jgi:hypothetical protein
MTRGVIFVAAALGWTLAANAQFFFPPPSVPVAANTCGPATWDPSNKDPAITLSGGNLVATQSSAGNNWRSVRGISCHQTGKFYLEMTLTAKDASDGWMGGFEDASGVLNSYIGSTAHGIGCQSTGTQVYWSGGSIAACNNIAYTAATVMEFAVDVGNNLVWIRGSGGNGNWNNSGTANPATSTGGTALHIGGGSVQVFPAWSGLDSGSSDASTLNTTGPFTGTAPSGFVAWN